MVIGKVHPNIFETVGSFKKEQASTEVSLVQLAAGVAPPRHCRRVIRREQMIAELKQYVHPVGGHTLAYYISQFSCTGTP